MAVAVIGVGGLGRGVCNWLKQRLEHEYGSPASAGFSLLVIDGPEKESQYVLPGSYQIDTSPHSTEFYHLTKLPGKIIENVAKGEACEFIDSWLTQSEAGRITDPEGIIPSNGYGQLRPAGRVGIFLEASQIVGILRTLVTGQSWIIMVGSQCGGTGSGMLLDIAQMIRHVKPQNARFDGYIGLPPAFSFVFQDEQLRREANTRGFAGMRELERQCESPSIVSYCSGVEVSNTALFDGCFIVDGKIPEGSDLTNVPPVHGLCAMIADHILTLYGTPIATSNATNWVENSTFRLDGRPPERGYWSAGIFTYLYDWKALETSFALRFAHSIYDAMLTVPPKDANVANDQATSVLQATGPGAMALELATHHALAIQWPELNQPDSLRGLLTLRRNFRTRSPSSTPGPLPDYGLVRDWVDVTGVFRRVENADVISQCHAFTARHIGQPQDRANPNTDASLWGWLNYQHGVICREFVATLGPTLQDLFYNRKDGTWQTLSQRPYSIVIARDLLQTCLSLLKSELDEVTKVLRQFSDKIMDHATQALKEAEEELLTQDRSRTAQENYIQGPYQWYHVLQEWQALMRAYESTLMDMISLADNLWRKIGHPVEGWIGHLDKCRERVHTEYNHNLGVRQFTYDRVKARRYVPQPGGLAEEALYRKIVTDGGHVSALLGQLRFVFMSPLAGAGGSAFEPSLSASEIANSYDGYLIHPSIPGYQPLEGEQRGLYDGVDGKYVETFVHSHRPEIFIQVGRNNCGPRLQQMTIWDVLELEAAAAQLTPEQYAQEVQSTLFSRSKRALGLVGTANPVETLYEVTLHKQDSAISQQVAEAMKRNQVQQVVLGPDTPFRYSLAMATVAVRLRLTDWASYTEMREDYYKLRTLLPVHTYPEERIATDYVEEYLLQHHQLSVNDLPLHYTVCRHLTDWDAFQAFAVCYLLLGNNCELTLPLVDTGGGSAHRRLEVQNVPTGGGHYATCDLGLACNMNGVLSTLMAQNALAEQARVVLKNFANDLIEKASSNNELRSCVGEYLRPASFENIILPPLDPTHPEELNREHLQHAMWAAVWQYVERKLGI